uniref:ATP-dependent RNA helicase n=1 Tax=Malurus cyaneus samueli TaxID=2593467 RepID=A0A8C5TLP1_9PASS
MKVRKGGRFRSSFKLKRKGIEVVGEWKTVQIDPNLFAEEEFRDIVCLEELTDYKLVSSSKVGKVKEKKRKAESASEEGSEVEEPVVPPKKKKKKKQRFENDVSAWKDLFVPEPVLQALSYLGFTAPTPIQALALPSAIRDNMDVLGAAETGSGKTLAFAIPMIHSVLQWQKSNNSTTRNDSVSKESHQHHEETRWENEDEAEKVTHQQVGDSGDEDDASFTTGCVKVLENVEFDFDDKTHTVCSDKKRPLLGLVLTPTRELAVQVKHHIDAVAKFTDIKTQERVLNRKPEIVIERHPHLSNLRQLRCLVIDEADRMVEKGHFVELSQLLEILNDSQYNPRRQTFVFSATLTLVHQIPTRVLQKKNAKKMDKKTKLELLMEKVGIRGKPKVIDLTRKEATVETLTETRIHCNTNEKDYYLYYFLLQYPGRTMVFANSIDCVKRLSSLLTILHCDPLPLHANMHQKQRLKNLERFAERESCVLLTTDVAARGLDIPNVQHVIHYQVPRTSELYVHRSGRTARAANEGLSLLLIGPEDLINFRKIYKTLEKSEELPIFPIDTKCMTSIKERMNLARQIEKAEFFNSKAKQHNSWLQQAAEALEMDLDDDMLMGRKADEQEESQKQKMLKGMKKQLKHMLSQPLFKVLMKTKYPTQSGKLLLPQTSVGISALGAMSKKQAKKKKSIKSN